MGCLMANYVLTLWRGSRDVKLYIFTELSPVMRWGQSDLGRATTGLPVCSPSQPSIAPSQRVTCSETRRRMADLLIKSGHPHVNSAFVEEAASA